MVSNVRWVRLKAVASIDSYAGAWESVIGSCGSGCCHASVECSGEDDECTWISIEDEVSVMSDAW